MAVSLGGVSLPDDLAWPDEYEWQTLSVNTEYSLTGALLVQIATKLAGRPITLQSNNDRSWVTRAVASSIKALQTAGDQVTLTVRGQTFTVLIVEVTATPLWDWSDESDPCTIVIKCLTV